MDKNEKQKQRKQTNQEQQTVNAVFFSLDFFRVGGGGWGEK